MMNNRQKGAAGEKIAREYLEKSGYKILNTNFHYSKYSEVDIIEKEKNTIVFVEVKTRSTTNYGHPFESINPKKLEHIYAAALYYLQQTKEQHKNFRIDVISVLTPENPKIEHLKNVWIN